MTKFIDAGDIDLDEEEVYLKDGTRLTEAEATKLGERIAKYGPGRPSLTGKRERSPHVSARVPDELKAKVNARAKREHKKASDVVRDALEHYV